MGKLSIKRYFKMMGIYAKMDLASLLRDTKFMLIAIFSDICANISSISGIFLLAWKFGGIGGLDKFEILFMLAYGNIVFGLLHLAGGCNALFPSRIIGRGQWEHMFIMPVPYAAQLTVGVFPFTCFSDFLSGIVMMLIAVNNLKIILPWWWGLTLAANIVISAVTMVSLSYLAASLTFYAPVQCEEISSLFIYRTKHLGTFPLSGMPAYLKLPLLTILPAGLAAWLPTMIAFGKTPDWASFYPICFALLISALAAHFFKKGFKYYVKKGINRYVAGGHRS